MIKLAVYRFMVSPVCAVLVKLICIPNDLPTNQLVVRQFMHWSTRGLDSSWTGRFVECKFLDIAVGVIVLYHQSSVAFFNELTCLQIV